MLSNCWSEMMKHKGLSFYHSVWFRPGRIKTNYLIKSHEWWLGLWRTRIVSPPSPDISDPKPDTDAIPALLVLMTSLAEMKRRVQPRYSESTFANICNCDHCQSRGTFLISDKDRILPVSEWGEVWQSVTLCLVSTVWDMCRYNCQLSQQQHDIQYYNINFQVWDVDRVLMFRLLPCVCSEAAPP